MGQASPGVGEGGGQFYRGRIWGLAQYLIRLVETEEDSRLCIIYV